MVFGCFWLFLDWKMCWDDQIICGIYWKSEPTRFLSDSLIQLNPPMLAVSPRPTLISQLLLGQISLPLMTRLFNMVGGHPSTDSHLSQLQFRSRNMQITNNLEIYLETHAPSNLGLWFATQQKKHALQDSFDWISKLAASRHVALVILFPGGSERTMAPLGNRFCSFLRWTCSAHACQILNQGKLK